MAKVKTTARFQILEFIDRFIDGATASDIGATIADEAKNMIANGISPVKGYGRFERYKNKERYPGDLKDARPVNLNLTGEMLDHYTFKFETKSGSVFIGVIGGGAKVQARAQAHQEGTSNMAQRRLVPGDGEEWAVSIMRILRDLYSKRLAYLINRANKNK